MIAMDADLKQARTLFFARQKQNQLTAMQRIALQIIAGIDLDEVLKAPLEEKERTKRNWNYDLNRHIALKQAFDRIG